MSVFCRSRVCLAKFSNLSDQVGLHFDQFASCLSHARWAFEQDPVAALFRVFEQMPDLRYPRLLKRYRFGRGGPAVAEIQLNGSVCGVDGIEEVEVGGLAAFTSPIQSAPRRYFECQTGCPTAR